MWYIWDRYGILAWDLWDYNGYVQICTTSLTGSVFLAHFGTSNCWKKPLDTTTGTFAPCGPLYSVAAEFSVQPRLRRTKRRNRKLGGLTCENAAVKRKWLELLGALEPFGIQFVHPVGNFIITTGDFSYFLRGLGFLHRPGKLACCSSSSRGPSLRRHGPVRCMYWMSYLWVNRSILLSDVY